MAMNPRTHPRGAPPDFSMVGLPRNPNPSRVTDALWWLVCMRELLEPTLSENGGTFANKPGHHNAGENLPMPGRSSDSSIKYSYDRSGPWWREFCSAHDWTFKDAQNGDYRTIIKYTRRLVQVMRDPNDTRPDDVYAYTLGQLDNDRVVEGYNERTDADETSADETHNWHRHDSFRRNIIGSFPHMWKALTIDMGWTFAEWQRSISPPPAKEWSDMATEEQIKNALRTVLEESHRLPGGPGVRLHKPKSEGGPGWGEMSDRLIAAYAFEALLGVSDALSAFVAYEKAEDTAEAGGDTTRSEALARLEAASARIEALVQGPPPTEV